MSKLNLLSDFSDYFKNCAEVEQQSIIDELLKMSASQGAMVDNSDAKAILCPHCQGKSIRGNGKLKVYNVMYAKVVLRTLAKRQVNFGLP
jgi:type II secretory ATPase GspE/PulE/Tfp pilus assembly ATPase PilB-like protein